MVEVPPSEEFSRNLSKIAEYYQHIMRALAVRQAQEKQVSSDPFNIGLAFTETLAKIWSDPEKMLQHQMDYANRYWDIINNSTTRFMGEEAAPVYQPAPKDNRFKDKAWEENPVFDFIKQSYLMTADWMQEVMGDVEGLDSRTEKKVQFYTKQFIDALSPTNFALTNPVVLKTTLESGGENLARGLENFLRDLEGSGRYVTIKTADDAAFEVGKNLAVTPGKVIYQNDMMQLIHYAPLAEKTYKRPLLVIPPWINKYYILDMKPENSFVRWLLEQGYSVFMISWVNPDKELGHKDFEDYMLEGPLAALDAVQAATGEQEVNVIGYCLGGTLLSATLSYMKAKGDERIKSVTLLTTQIDFSEAGDLLIFVDDEQLHQVEERMQEEGFFDGSDMAATFNMLRANDMIWSFVVNNYLLGKDPFPFDLLYWNSDSTRLTAKAHSFYLRNMYQYNLLAKKHGVHMAGVPVDVTEIDIPCYMLSTREDHIAPWKSTFKATKLLKSNITFVLSASGHIAGVVNHPRNQKYCYWTNADTMLPAENWLEGATEHSGSWWQNWHQWQQTYAGEKVKAPIPGEGKLPALEEAPGSYVKVRC